MTRFALLALVGACSPTSNAAPSPPPRPASPDAPRPADAPPRKPPDTALSCKSDADCPHLSCGPCKSGDTVLQEHVDIGCEVNPCPGAVAVCRAGTCVVR